ncbi:MAG: efflux RND transporter periplasmic adaptor subunit [Nitrosomonadales bacterium]|nr:efflux RND transporter periplasmic adaptor subunit [Nitrosomonadales bacterium]
MEIVSQTQPVERTGRRAWIATAGILLIALSAGVWVWHDRNPAAKTKGTGAIQIVSAPVARSDVPVRLTANGTVSARQAVEVRPQVSATVKTVHIKEGQFVRRGDRLLTLDARTENANLDRTEAQAVKVRADLANAERNLDRQRQLFSQEYISQAEFDAAQNQVDGLRSQLAIEQASVEAGRVARGYSEITAPIAGRTGAIAIYPGSLVQPNGAALVNISQIDPINVSFTLPERELVDLQRAFARGEVPVGAKLDAPGQPDLKGRLVFVDNAVDTASGTIRLKAEFANPDNRLWPGMFVTVTLSPRTLADAVTVPVQAVQTGPEKKFLYVVGEGHKVASQPVDVRLIQDGIAVIEGVAPGARVVVEGAQNLRPGDVVTEPGNGAAKQ